MQKASVRSLKLLHRSKQLLEHCQSYLGLRQQQQMSVTLWFLMHDRGSKFIQGKKEKSRKDYASTARSPAIPK